METKIIKCKWCGKEFPWDSSMYAFCNTCIDKIEQVEKVVERITGTYINLFKDLERLW